MPRPKTKKLTPEQVTVLKGRAALRAQAVTLLGAARWYNRRKRYAAALEAHGVLNDVLIAVAGVGSVLSFDNGEPVVTLP
jgi:hypothetical protein